MLETKALVDKILSSHEWTRAAAWGEARPGHPEGTIGRHVDEQVLPFIDRWYRDLADYWNLVALAYLHDIGKPEVRFEGGRVRSEPHSVLSAKIAERLGAPERLVHVILLNDRAYSHWRKLLNKSGQWTPTRWTAERRSMFIEEFGNGIVDLEILVRFHRADNAYRRAKVLEESVDGVFWFENRLVEEGLLLALPLEGKDQRLSWSEAS